MIFNVHILQIDWRFLTSMRKQKRRKSCKFYWKSVSMKQKGEIWYFTCHMCDFTGVLRSVSFSPEKRSQLNQVVDSPIKTCKVSTFAIQKHNSRVQEVYKSTGNQADKEETNFDVLPLTYFSIIVCLSTNKNWNKLCTHILWTYN